MAWSEHHRAMLQEMGLRVWSPADVAVGEPEVAVPPQALASAAQAAAQPPVRPPQGTTQGPSQGTTHGPTPHAAQRPPPRPAQAVAASAAPVVLTPRAAGIDTMDWPALQSAVSGCTACKLCQGRTQTVFGVGNPRAHWMIVGEAPGEQEDLQGEPFVGKSGQLLDNMLRAIALTRGEAAPERQVYIANSVKCRPPGNRNPEPDELAQCEPFLIRQLALVQPKIILAMGRFAVQSLLRTTEPIGKLRGRVHHYQGVPLIVTYHPAYLLRSLAEKARAWDDLCLALDTLKALERP
jgi:uracil-DNA glycosylase family 4